MKFSFVTLFPNLIEPYFHDSILKKAVEKSLISYDFYNP
ncbi:MAG: tRNA (guanosine(37)-N1)-methyltransferase TrmD, partial [Campylobacterota bacterium]|nr:tRNA (guanosine(37)-N1)-methyltransferase TrmD [Campylobacterota bacterium]